MYTLHPPKTPTLKACCTIGNEKGVHMYTLYPQDPYILRPCCTIGNEKGVHMYTLYLPKTPTLRACCTIGNEKVNPNGISTSFETLQKNIIYIFFSILSLLFFSVFYPYINYQSPSFFFSFTHSHSLSLSLFLHHIYPFLLQKSWMHSARNRKSSDPGPRRNDSATLKIHTNKQERTEKKR